MRGGGEVSDRSTVIPSSPAAPRVPGSARARVAELEAEVERLWGIIRVAYAELGPTYTLARTEDEERRLYEANWPTPDPP